VRTLRLVRTTIGLARFGDFSLDGERGRLSTLRGAWGRGSRGGFGGEKQRRWALVPVRDLSLGHDDALVDSLAVLWLALPRAGGKTPFLSDAATWARR
jgi:hypothetical protein